MDRATVILCAALLTGCAAPDTVTVKVPIYQRAEPPAELLAPIDRPAGVFVPPAAAGVVACLAPAGKDALVGHIEALRRRVTAWEAWGKP